MSGEEGDEESEVGESSSYQRDLNYPEGREDSAKLLADGRSAILPSDRTRLRVTPPGDRLVTDLVRPGDRVRTNYGERGVVSSVSKHVIYGLPCFTVTYVSKKGDTRWVSECVAQDGRILQLFEKNLDEVKVIRRAPLVGDLL